MEKRFSLGFSDVKNFLSNEVNRVFMALLVLIALMICAQYRNEARLSAIETNMSKNQESVINEITENRKKLNFRYFNLNQSLEEISGKKFDTKTGKIEK